MPKTRLIAFVVLALAVPAGGCSAYREHTDTVARSAGDAVAANIAIQTIDPWPYASSKTEIQTDGRRVKRVIDRYAPAESSAASDASGQPTTTPTTATGG